MHDNIEVSNSCNCCNKYLEEIKDLKISLAKFSIGKSNLDIILGKQRCVFDKAGLGYKLDKQQKFYKSFFASTQKYSSPFLTCFYCG